MERGFGRLEFCGSICFPPFSEEAVWTSDATVIETPLLLASCSDVQAYASDLIEQHTSEPALAVATKPKKAARKVCFALLEDDFSTEPLSAHVEVSSLSVAALELQDTVVEAPIEVAPRRVLKSCMKKGSGVVHYADAPCTFAPLPERPELEDCKVTFEYTCHNLLVGCMIGAEEASPLTRPSAALKASPAVPLKKTVSFIKDDVSEVRSYTAVRPTYECEEDCEEKDREWNETPFTSVKALKHQLSFERSCLSLPDRTYSSSFHQFEISGCIIHKWKRRSTTHFANWLILLHLGEIMPEVHAPTYDVY